MQRVGRAAVGSMCAILSYVVAGPALAHGVPEGDKAFIEQSIGLQLGPFVYLGAKHMVTGYDHLLFLVGVIFFLYRLKDVAAYVTLFAIGHSVTLLAGVLAGTGVSAYLVDAVIGLSVTYKALDNLGTLKRWLGFQPNTKAAVLLFGLVHGLGLATKLQEFSLSPEGLVANIVAFNVGVEVGQFLALTAILIAMGYWRRSSSFSRHANTANMVLAATGLVLFAFQIAGYFGLGQEAS
jgi:hypothetical protein